jgi:hypothetical protein
MLNSLKRFSCVYLKPHFGFGFFVFWVFLVFGFAFYFSLFAQWITVIDFQMFNQAQNPGLIPSLVMMWCHLLLWTDWWLMIDSSAVWPQGLTLARQVLCHLSLSSGPDVILIYCYLFFSPVTLRNFAFIPQEYWSFTVFSGRIFVWFGGQCNPGLAWSSEVHFPLRFSWRVCVNLVIFPP